MKDQTGGPWGSRAPASAHAAALEVDVQTALALSRAAVNTLKALSPEASDVVRRQLQRELHRLKLGEPSGADVTAVRLRAFLND